MSRADELMPINRDLTADLEIPISERHRAALEIEDLLIPGPSGAPDIRVIVYRPKDAVGPPPLIVSIHGGEFVLLRADTMAGRDADWAVRFGAVVVGVDYGLAPEHPFPAAPEECYTSLCWAVKELDIDEKRVAVTGGSAGGALAAAVCLMARDRNGPRIALQALQIPVLDDRIDTPSMLQFRDSPPSFEGSFFSGRRAEGMWLHYLGEDYDRSNTSPYAAPARAASLTGLPRAFIQVHGRDPLRDEGLQYAQRLLAAGVPVELHLAPDLFHGPNEPDHPQALQEIEQIRTAFATALS